MTDVQTTTVLVSDHSTQNHPVDIGTIAGYIAGGGLSAVGAFFALVDPHRAPIYIGAGAAVVSLAGLLKTIFNKTPGAQASITTPTAPKKGSASIDPAPTP